jgi:hypothetical protein
MRRPHILSKRRPLIILAFCCLFCLATAGFAEQIRLGPGQGALLPAVQDKLARQFPGEKSLGIDLAAIRAGYPGFCPAVSVGPGPKLYLVMRDGAKIIYDDGRRKTFAEKLNKPDLKDMLSQLYRPGAMQEPFRPDYDPGRFRVDAFFKTVYGASAAAVRANLVPVRFCGARVMFNDRNGAAQALAEVGRELTALLKKRPQLKAYIFPLGGTFVWRPIAGTRRLSPHSWGIAIDLNPRRGAYWRSRKIAGPQVEELRRRYPLPIVAVFEKHGFIWGGKWSHFDLMHFEYRPELLRKWQLRRQGGLAN